MSKNWIYAKMSQEAARAGGPELWLEAIKNAAYKRGASDMKNTLVVPLLAAGASVGSLTVIAAQKLQRWVAEKRQDQIIDEQEAEAAETYLKKELADVIEEVKTDNGGSAG